MHFSLKVSIADVSGPDIQIIELGQEDKEADSAEGNNTRVDTIKWDFSEVPVGNKSALMAPIMLHVKDKVYTNLPVTFRGLSSLAQVLEGLVFVELGHLKGSRVLPLGVAIALV